MSAGYVTRSGEPDVTLVSKRIRTRMARMKLLLAPLFVVPFVCACASKPPVAPSASTHASVAETSRTDNVAVSADAARSSTNPPPAASSHPASSTTASANAAPTRKPVAEAARLQRDVAWLADDVREGRRAGTSKCLDAAEFLATRMQTLGLEPAGTVGFGQEFDVPLEAR